MVCCGLTFIYVLDVVLYFLRIQENTVKEIHCSIIFFKKFMSINERQLTHSDLFKSLENLRQD